MLKNKYTDDYSHPQAGEGQGRCHPMAASTVAQACLGTDGQEVSLLCGFQPRDDASKPLFPLSISLQQALSFLSPELVLWGGYFYVLVPGMALPSPSPPFPPWSLEVRQFTRRCAQPMLAGGPCLHFPLLGRGNNKLPIKVGGWLSGGSLVLLSG